MLVWVKFCFNLLCWVVVMLIGLFYVGVGFGLYFNCCIEMEVWDVEIVF